MAKPHILAAIRNHRAQCVRYLLILLLAGAMLTPGVYNIGKTQSAAIATLTQTADISQLAQVIRWRKNSVDADKPHTLAASYYSLQGNLKATLMFNNKGPNPLEVRPALFSIFGDRFDAPTVTVNANSFREVDMSEWVAIAGPSFAEGNLQILYKGPDLVLERRSRWSILN